MCMEICVHLKQGTRKIDLFSKDSQSTAGWLSPLLLIPFFDWHNFPTVATAMNEIVPYKDR